MKEKKRKEKTKIIKNINRDNKYLVKFKNRLKESVYLSSLDMIFEEGVTVDLYFRGDAFIIVTLKDGVVFNTQSSCIKDKYSMYILQKKVYNSYECITFYVNLKNTPSIICCDKLSELLGYDSFDIKEYRVYYKRSDQNGIV